MVIVNTQIQNATPNIAKLIICWVQLYNYHALCLTSELDTNVLVNMLIIK